MTAHDLVDVLDLGWQPTGFTTPPVYRLDLVCSCGQVATVTAPGGPAVARGVVDGMQSRHALLADLEERLVRAFSGESLLPGSTLMLTERAAVRMAGIALAVFTAPTEPEEESPREP